MHLLALLVFVALAVAFAILGGIRGDAVFGYVLVCACFLLPLSAAVYVFGRYALSHRVVTRELAGNRGNDTLPRGIAWVYPPHQPGECGSPETAPDAMVED